MKLKLGKFMKFQREVTFGTPNIRMGAGYAT